MRIVFGKMISIILFIACLGATIDEGAYRRDVDIVELNHYYDPNGRLVFDQYIFYDWDNRNHRPQVAFWRLAKLEEKVFKRHRRWDQGYYEIWFIEDDKRVMIRANVFIETSTQEDPELIERDFLPKDRRRGLFKKGD